MDVRLVVWLMRRMVEVIPLSLENLLRRPARHRECLSEDGAWSVRQASRRHLRVSREKCASGPVCEECPGFALANKTLVGLLVDDEHCGHTAQLPCMAREGPEACCGNVEVLRPQRLYGASDRGAKESP